MVKLGYEESRYHGESLSTSNVTEGAKPQVYTVKTAKVSEKERNELKGSGMEDWVGIMEGEQ
jgi:hypothetical protein